MQNAPENYNESKDEFENEEKEQTIQEEWMIISDIHNTINLNQVSNQEDSQDWKEGSLSYSQQQLGEMPNWIKATKETSQFNYNDSSQTDVSTFSAEQRLTYNSVKSHFNSPDTDEPLLLIINGVGGN